MSRRICLACLAAAFALGAPTASLAQTSSQAQYQGVAPETQTPVGGGTGTGTGGASGNGSGTGNASGSGGTSSSKPGGTSGTSGNGGAITGVPVPGAPKTNLALPDPSASSDTIPFTSTDIILLALGALTLVGLGVVLRRSTPPPPA